MIPIGDDNSDRRSTPWLTWCLIALNVVVFVFFQGLGTNDRFTYAYSTVPQEILSGKDVVTPDKVVTLRSGGRVVVPGLGVTPVPVYLTILFSMFMHGGFAHIIGNMLFLFVFGDNVEDRLGPLLYLVLYLLGGVIASVSHWVVDPNSVLPVIGASGAVAAVLGAYAIAWPWARVRTLLFLLLFVTIVDVPAMFFLGAWFILQVVAGHQSLYHAGSGGVAWWAHVGGFLAGIILMPVFSLLAGGTKSDNSVIEE
jgi:membrane associated rhomboid family serine protease